MQLNFFGLIIWSWDLALMDALIGQVLSHKKMKGFVGLRRMIYLVRFVFFFLQTKFGGHVPRILPPKNLFIAKFHEPYKSSNYIMLYKTMINVLEDSKKCLKVLRMYEVPLSF